MNVIQMVMFVTGISIHKQVNILKRLNNLDRVPLFKNLDEKYLKLLKPLFESYSCDAGVKVLQQDAPADYLYVIISGTVEMTYKPYDGALITISHVEKDGLFGWSAVVGSEKYTSSAIAIEQLEALRIRGSELRKLCVEHPEAGKEILERLASSVSSRWSDANEQIKSILAQGMQNR
jgi:CRP-like cAMP-binding protein